MPGEPVFLDTACLIALLRRKDGLHAAAQAVMKNLAKENCPLVTSEWVLSEFLGGASAAALRAAAAGMVRQLAASPVTTIHEASHAMFEEVLDFYAARSDKEWSFVDCSSIVICQSEGVRRVFTHDHHFRQAGFEVLLT